MRRVAIVEIAALLVVLFMLCFVVAAFAPKIGFEPQMHWIAIGTMMLVLVFIAALLVLVLGLIVGGAIAAWSLVVEKKNPFARVDPNDLTSFKNAAAVIVLGTFVIGGLTAIPFAFRLPGLVTRGLHPWLAAEFTALGNMLVGTLFGFLFGLPHFNDPVAVSVPSGGSGTSTNVVATPLFTPSSNLEKISNQLVVLFSGAAFASLLTIPHYIASFAAFFSDGIHGHESTLLGAAIITYFGPLGFINAYIVTRTVGAQAFARSDVALMGIASDLTNNLAPVPDTAFAATGTARGGGGTVLSADDLAKLNDVVAVSFSSLDTPEKLQTWGRAQFALGNVASARQAFDRAYATAPTNPRVVLDYATALYQDPSWNDFGYVLDKVELADALEQKNSANVTPTLRARTLALKAATKLYLPDGYVDAISIVSGLIQDATLPVQQVEHFYRACGLGQLAWAYAKADLIAVGDHDWNALIDAIIFDAAVAMAMSDSLRKQVLMVADPSAGRSIDQDCDLQFVAAADPRVRSALGITAAVALPNPVFLPEVVAIPGIPPGSPVGSIAAWIAKFSPPSSFCTKN